MAVARTLLHRTGIARTPRLVVATIPLLAVILRHLITRRRRPITPRLVAPLPVAVASTAAVVAVVVATLAAVAEAT